MISLASAQDRSAAAGEYVLGTLSDEDRDIFSAALASDRALQTEVYVWQDSLLSLSAQAEHVEPRSQVWQRIEGDLFVAAATTAAKPVGHAVTPALPWWQRVAPWRGISAFAVAVSLVLATVLVQRSLQPETPSVRYLAVLQSPAERATGWVVEIEARHVLRLVPVATMPALPAGRSLQFWTKPEGAAAPTSLGLVTAGQRVELPVSRLPGVGEQQLFEITLEPENGSPLGRPTGPILYVGRSFHL